MNYAGADMQMAELWDRYAAACTDRNALAAELATVQGIADARMTRIEELEAELMVLREFAGNKCSAQKVIDALGPMSLWSKDALEKHIAKEIAARSAPETPEAMHARIVTETADAIAATSKETGAKQFTVPVLSEGDQSCVHCGKGIGYHYQTAEGNLFCEVPTEAIP